ncbi:MAG: glycosyl transferase family 2 [Bacteroidetes bacterium]|jgi:dolichol-phosphate mannosyltransferase|nr:glycosyl transferase family 2 [Bacteroidota bacterium]
MAKLTYIIPCYFNEQNIPVTSAELIDNEKNFSPDVTFEYIFIDDGSKDNTYAELLKFHNVHPTKVKIIKLAGNVGSYNAILAGMNYSTGDCNVIIAADLQDPLDLVPKMYDYWCKGVKFVIANRKDREESFGQKLFSNTYHFLMRKFALENIPPGGFDFVLFDKQLCKQVVDIDESNTNTIYLLSWLNYDFVSIPYVRKKREIGKSRWTLKKKVKLFVDSFVSFSYAPIRLISLVGILLGLSAFAYGIFVIIAKFTGNIPISGWTSMMVVLLFVSAFQMTALGIIGEYVWRANDSAKKRPNFIVDKTIL